MKSIAQLFLILVLCLSLLLAFAACNGDGNTPSENDGTGDTPPTNGNTDTGNTETNEPYLSTYGDNVIDFGAIA